MPSDPAPDTKLHTTLIKKPTRNVTPQCSHPYGTRSKTKVNSIALESSSEDENKVDPIVLESSSVDERSFGEVGNLFNCLTNCCSKGVTGTNIYSTILCANNPFLLLCDPNLYSYCRVVCGHGLLRFYI